MDQESLSPFEEIAPKRPHLLSTPERVDPLDRVRGNPLSMSIALGMVVIYACRWNGVVCQCPQSSTSSD
jgi:hypothetical protein